MKKDEEIELRILLVEGDSEAAKAIKKTFKTKFGVLIKTFDIAHSFNQAKEFIKNNQYNRILLAGVLTKNQDIHEIQRFGFNLIPIIRESASSKAIIVMIDNEEKYNVVGVNMGADCVFVKDKFYKIRYESDTSFVDHINSDFEVIQKITG